MFFRAFVAKFVLVILCYILFLKCIENCCQFDLSDGVAASSSPTLCHLAWIQ